MTPLDSYAGPGYDEHMSSDMPKTPISQTIMRLFLGVGMTFAGVSHLTFSRTEFLAQVPSWVPLDADFVVVSSGVVEIVLGLGLLLLPRYRLLFGLALAAFYIAIFPGNIAQYVDQVDAFGLDTDMKRFVRLFFQPVLIAAALWASGVLGRHKKH